MDIVKKTSDNKGQKPPSSFPSITGAKTSSISSNDTSDSTVTDSSSTQAPKLNDSLSFNSVSSSDSNIELPEIKSLKSKLASSIMPSALCEKASLLLKRAELGLKHGGHLSGFDQAANYIDWITNLPWETRSEDNINIETALNILNKNHYGLSEIKDRILEYLSVLKLNIEKTKLNNEINHSFARAPILFFVGLVGSGKTTMAISIAEAIGRKFARIPFGGMGSALDLRGQSRVHPDAEVGLVIKALKRVGTKNPVILLDELDRVTEHSRADIMGVLVELLDPEQNNAFTDHFIDYPFDLSEVLFIATANNTRNISTAVMDRLEPIQMPSYTDNEKIVIGKLYIFPTTLKNSGLTPAQLHIDDDVWPTIVRPLGYDSGLRTLERTINGVCRKVARAIVEKKGNSFHITQENVKHFLPKW